MRIVHYCIRHVDWELKSKMEEESDGVLRKLVVLYGSQTGTAEEVAERIGRGARRRFIVPNVLAMDDYNIVCTFSSHHFLAVGWQPGYQYNLT